MRISRLASVALICSVLAGCSGGGTTTSSLPKTATPGLPAAPASKLRGKANFVIKVPTKKTAAARIRRSTGGTRSPQYVSVATQSVSISANGAAATVANLAPSSPNCTAATATTPLTCTIAVAAPIGYDTFAVAAYDGQNATGNLLSQGNVAATISGVAANTVALTLDGVIAALALVLANPSPPPGAAVSIPLSINALDADGNMIIGQGAYGGYAIQLADSDTSGALTFSRTTVTDPTTVVALDYNGAHIPGGSATITVIATDVSGGSVSASALFTPGRPSKIYVSNSGNNTLTTYYADGSASTPTITGLSNPWGVAVDAAGKIYVADRCDAQCQTDTGTVTTYNADGSASNPTITGLSFPYGVAVDAAGKIYVADLGHDKVSTYNADGSASTPTITGLNGPSGVAVDAAGKIYVASQCGQTCGTNTGTVTTYNADGSATTPTITGLNYPTSVAVDVAGKIYVANGNGGTTVMIYNADGSASTPTISGLNIPTTVAVDAAGKIYVVDVGNNAVTTYNADGSATTPTISGLPNPIGIAVR